MPSILLLMACSFGSTALDFFNKIEQKMNELNRKCVKKDLITLKTENINIAKVIFKKKLPSPMTVLKSYNYFCMRNISKIYPYPREIIIMLFKFSTLCSVIVFSWKLDIHTETEFNLQHQQHRRELE